MAYFLTSKDILAANGITMSHSAGGFALVSPSFRLSFTGCPLYTHMLDLEVENKLSLPIQKEDLRQYGVAVGELAERYPEWCPQGEGGQELTLYEKDLAVYKKFIKLQKEAPTTTTERFEDFRTTVLDHMDAEGDIVARPGVAYVLVTAKSKGKLNDIAVAYGIDPSVIREIKLGDGTLAFELCHGKYAGAASGMPPTPDFRLPPMLSVKSQMVVGVRPIEVRPSIGAPIENPGADAGPTKFDEFKDPNSGFILNLQKLLAVLNCETGHGLTQDEFMEMRSGTLGAYLKTRKGQLTPSVKKVLRKRFEDWMSEQADTGPVALVFDKFKEICSRNLLHYAYLLNTTAHTTNLDIASGVYSKRSASAAADIW